MLYPIAPTRRAILRKIFGRFPWMSACIEAVLEGRMGEAFADDPDRPSIGMLQLQLTFFAGNANIRAAREAVTRLRKGGPAIIVPDASWQALLLGVWGEWLRSYRRISFRAGNWDLAALDRLAASLPAGFALRPINTEQDARRLETELASSLISNFGTPRDFAARGIAFAIEHDGRFIAAIASFAIGRRFVEIEIHTHRNYRQRGLAAALGARMIRHCLHRDLTPAWDAANAISAALARKLGFVPQGEYEAYYLPSR